MNRLIVTGEEAGVRMWYGDTDSTVLAEDDIPMITEAYERKYGKKLHGKDLSQFHVDIDDFRMFIELKNDKVTQSMMKLLDQMGIPFTVKGCVIDIPNKRKGELFDRLKKYKGLIINKGSRKAMCTEGYFVWKKNYALRLHSKDESDQKHEKIVTKLKGISKRAIEWKAKELGKSPIELYKDMINLKRHEFNLIHNGLAGGKMSIEYLKSFTIKQREKLTRSVGIIKDTEIILRVVD